MHFFCNFHLGWNYRTNAFLNSGTNWNKGLEMLKLKLTLPILQFFGIAVYAINVKIEQGHQWIKKFYKSSAGVYFCCLPVLKWGII